MTATRLEGPSGTNNSLPSRVKSMPTGCNCSGRTPGTSKVIFLVTFQVLGSITETVPPTSDDTHSSLLSALNLASRGRESTSTLAISLCVELSMTCAMLVDSEVATVYLPSLLTVMPSGSTPTGTSASTSPLAISMMVT